MGGAEIFLGMALSAKPGLWGVSGLPLLLEWKVSAAPGSSLTLTSAILTSLGFCLHFVFKNIALNIHATMT